MPTSLLPGQCTSTCVPIGTGISNCKHIPDREMSSSKAVDLHLRPAGSFQRTSTISAHSIRISARGRCMLFYRRYRRIALALAFGGRAILPAAGFQPAKPPKKAAAAKIGRPPTATDPLRDTGKHRRSYSECCPTATRSNRFGTGSGALEPGAPHPLPFRLLLFPPLHGARSAG